MATGNKTRPHKGAYVYAPHVNDPVENILEASDQHSFSKDWRYKLTTATRLATHQAKGFEVLVGEVEGNHGEQFILVGKLDDIDEGRITND